MSIYGLTSDYRTNVSQPEWYTAERYDYCEQFTVKEIAKKNRKHFNLFHFLTSLVF